MAEMKIILQPKVAVHMSSSLDDLERHTIIAALYHSSLLDQVLETAFWKRTRPHRIQLWLLADGR